MLVSDHGGGARTDSVSNSEVNPSRDLVSTELTFGNIMALLTFSHLLIIF